MSLVEALAQRRSQRSFADKPLSSEQIGQLCWAAQGITDEARGLRTAPSAMALYAIQVFVVDGSGLYEYVPSSHLLRRLDLEGALQKLRSAAGQKAVGSAPVSMILAMDPGRLEARCPEKAERYSLLEAGHVAQNVLLQATALKLVSVPMGGVDETKLGEALNLPTGLRPVYVLPLGRPSEKD
jgi:SagB-type dehydrogenase family enzyme